MTDIMMPTELANKVIINAHLPTSDRRAILPVSVDTVRVLIARAIMVDRATSAPDFQLIVKRLYDDAADLGHDGPHGRALTVESSRRMTTVALQHAQSGGARFKQGGPSEADYEEAVRAGVESFCSVLKDKGLWK